MNSDINKTYFIVCLVLVASVVCFCANPCHRLYRRLLHYNKDQNKGMPKRKHSGDEDEPETRTNHRAKQKQLKVTVDETDEHKPEAGQNQLHQSQIQLSYQRDLEASKQMLYGVYGNVVSILEEYEARTHEGTPLPRSNIALPDQSSKTTKTVRGIVQAQLMAFQMQSNWCRSEARNTVNKDLRKKTLIWAAVREERNLPLNDTDTFICQLYEILVSGKTHHDILDKPRPLASIETMKDTIPHIMQGTHDTATLDESFKKNPRKSASIPQTRTAYSDFSFILGASRLKREMRDLSDNLDEDVKYFLLDAPDDYK